MLVCIDEKSKVLWHNKEISKEESTKYLSENVFWFDIMPIPETPPLLQNETVELYLSAENILYYKKIENVLPVPEPTETEILMQTLADLELRSVEEQKDRQLLAQQVSDLELTILKGGI